MERSAQNPLHSRSAAAALGGESGAQQPQQEQPAWKSAAAAQPLPAAHLRKLKGVHALTALDVSANQLCGQVGVRYVR